MLVKTSGITMFKNILLTFWTCDIQFVIETYKEKDAYAK